MKSKKFTVAIILIFFVGLIVLLYPTVADYFNAKSQSRVVAQYYHDIEALNMEDFTELFEQARAYNEELLKNRDRFRLKDAEIEEYMGMLNPFNNGVMGTLIINAIDVRLPIYHGTGEGVLQIGAGHFEGTSLPIGGIGTHSVITGHRGLPSSTLLTRLDRMAIGDTFMLNVLNDVLTYKIDQIIVVLPDEMDELSIVADKDYCTLITCTPYGVNSHRMLVRGERTANALENIGAEAGLIDGILVAALMIAPVFIIVAVIFGIRVKKIYKRSKNTYDR